MKRTKKIGTLGVLVTLVGMMISLAPQSGFSQEKYPEKPITIIHGFGPGGQHDIFTRLMASIASKDLNQAIIIENRPGAMGMVGMHTVMKSNPDGYTLGTSVSSQFLITPQIQKVYFDPLNDPVHIVVYMHYDLGLAVRSDSPWKTWEEFKTYAKENPGKVRYGTAGAGSMQHLAFEFIAREEKINWIHVPFKSGNEPVIALLGGHIEAAIQGPPDVVPHIKTGKLRLLLSLSKGRWPIAPDIPHLQEVGYQNTFSYNTIFGPKGLPEPIRLKLEKAFREAIKHPSFLATAAGLQAHIVHDVDAKEYPQMLKERAPAYKKIVYDLGLGLKE